MLHSKTEQTSSRQRCTVELWYHLPQADFMIDEIILVRRSLLFEEKDDVSKLCMPDQKHNTLWELAILPTGFLELRTGAGSVVTSASHIDAGDTSTIKKGLVSWEREDGTGGWNHVCLVLSSLSHSSLTAFSASILMNGIVVVPSATLLVNPFGLEPDQDLSEEDIEDAMERTVLIFGIGPSVGFRMTDLRVWACQREEDDIKMMMYEYLKDAEMKKKLKINIRKGARQPLATATEGSLLAPPPPRLLQHKSKRGGVVLAPPRPYPAERSTSVNNNTDFMPSFANFGENLADDKEDQISTKTNEDENSDLQGNDMSNHKSYFKTDAMPEEIGAQTMLVRIKDPPGDLVKLQSSLQNTENNKTLYRVNSENSVGDLSESQKEEERTHILSLKFVLSDMLSTKVRKSAATAIIRGPPAAKHFGGGRGGLAFQHINHGRKCDGVSPVAICGADKSVVWFTDRDPPGWTLPIGASGAVLSDVMDENQSQYMSCFLAKEKRIVVFELTQKTVVVELQMKTKLNFWRYLPPEAHGSTLAFVLITPNGGFHWKPLDESPRPSQVWKRCAQLETKKILSYEEGGSNGQTGTKEKSMVALVLASSAISGTSGAVEAYLIPMNNESSQCCISNAILGAALYRPPASSSSFLPFIVTITKDVTSQFVLDIEDLWEEDNTLARGIIESTVLMCDETPDKCYTTPSMSMGPLPEALCCCHGDFIVAVIRTKGLVFAYDFSTGDLGLVGSSGLGHYIVDAAIRPSNVDGEVELVLLLCESDDPKDGRVATVNISREDGVKSQCLNSI